MTVELGKVLAKSNEVKVLVDTPKEIILLDVGFNAKRVEKTFLAITLKPHHGKAPS